MKALTELRALVETFALQHTGFCHCPWCWHYKELLAALDAAAEEWAGVERVIEAKDELISHLDYCAVCGEQGIPECERGSQLWDLAQRGDIPRA